MISLQTEVVTRNGNIPLEMSYCDDDPAAVTFTFLSEGKEVQWVFARDLLKEFLDEGISGEGDVQFLLVENQVRMDLSSPEGKGYILLEEDIVQEFVDFIYDEVPDGEDSYEWPEYFILEEWSV